jgi:hypothetical protein
VPNSFADLASSMNRRASNLPRAVNAVAKALAEAVDFQVVISTPVDIGVARSNWVVSLGTPVDDFIEAYAPGSHLGIAEKANAFAAIIQGRKEIQDRQPGQNIVIQNNAPYIGRLNDGWSAQAPAGFVEGAIQHALISLNGLELKL